MPKNPKPATTPQKETKPVKKTSTKQSAPVVAPTPTLVPEPVLEPVVQQLDTTVLDNVVEVKLEDDVQQSFVDLMKKLQLLSTTFSALKSDFKTLEKRYMKASKAANKEKDRRKKTSTKPRQPSGFVKPTKISSELASFLEKPQGTEMARTEVTREINKYIRNNNLQDVANGRKINPDGKLRALLEVPVSDELTYFNLQKYLSKHFPKSTPVLETAS